MTQTATAPALRVAILALPDSAPLGVVGLYEVLGSVGSLWGQITGANGAGRTIVPLIVARTAEPFASSIGLHITPNHGLADLAPVDVVIVADVEIPLRDDPAGRWRDEIAWLRARAQDTPLVCSTCSGSVVLAEAGLLDGRDAASHWSAAALFRDRYPKVRYRPERILCDSGLNGRLITTGGASSWQDLSLYLIGRFCGAEEAARTARIFLIGDRSAGQLPFAAMTQPRNHADAAIAECQAWIAGAYDHPNAVAAMVERSGLAPRTFKRRFLLATGYTPIDYVQTLRIEEAKQCLETGAESVDAIAAQVGYEDPTFFRRLFKRQVGVTPARYRQSMKGLGARRLEGVG